MKYQDVKKINIFIKKICKIRSKNGARGPRNLGVESRAFQTYDMLRRTHRDFVIEAQISMPVKLGSTWHNAFNSIGSIHTISMAGSQNNGLPMVALPK